MTDYTRPVNPQFSSLMFFTWMLIFIKWLKDNKNNILFIVSAILLGSLFYTYPFSWMLAVGMVIIMILISLFNAKTEANLPFKKILPMLGIAFIISIPYFINFFESIRDPLYDVLQKRYGFYNSSEPIWSDLLAISLIIIIAIFWKRKKDTRFYLLLSFILTLIIATNQQIITSLRFYPGHWHWYYTTPMTVILLIWLLYSIFRAKVFRIILSILIAVVSISVGISKQVNSYERIKQESASYQRYSEVFNWINENTAKDDVILAQGALNEKLSVYTHANTYFSRWGEFYLVPHERFLDRQNARALLLNINSGNAHEYFTENNKDVYEYLFGRYRLRKGLCEEGCFTDSEIDEVKHQYLEFLEQADVETFLKKYRLDYALADTQNDDWQIDKYTFMEFITEIKGVRIYKVI